jgi:hypothetical protein
MRTRHLPAVVGFCLVLSSSLLAGCGSYEGPTTSTKSAITGTPANYASVSYVLTEGPSAEERALLTTQLEFYDVFMLMPMSVPSVMPEDSYGRVELFGDTSTRTLRKISIGIYYFQEDYGHMFSSLRISDGGPDVELPPGDGRAVQVRGNPGTVFQDEGGTSSLEWEEDGQFFAAMVGYPLSVEETLAWLDSWDKLP